MQVTRKVNHVTFEHDDEFKGDVVITRGAGQVTVPMEALRVLIAESVRRERIAAIEKMRPADLLRGIA
jgi:hypothetical protein